MRGHLTAGEGVNPSFAAKMIEESKPTFKNSLINYLSLRKSPKAAHRAVLDAVANRAATDLSTVPEDATVDRSNVIRVGFILVAIAVATVAYMMLSPKNPFQTVGRILAPTAKIAKPAIVQISEVDPGDASVFFGDSSVLEGRFLSISVVHVCTTAFAGNPSPIVEAEVAHMRQSRGEEDETMCIVQETQVRE